MEDKRKAIRVRTNAVVSFKIQTARLAGGSRIKDISELGVCMPSKHYFAVDSILEVEIRSDDLKEPIRTMARVVRIANRFGKFPYEVGMVFLRLSETERSVIQEHVRLLMAQGQKDISWIE